MAGSGAQPLLDDKNSDNHNDNYSNDDGNDNHDGTMWLSQEGKRTRSPQPGPIHAGVHTEQIFLTFTYVIILQSLDVDIYTFPPLSWAKPWIV